MKDNTSRVKRATMKFKRRYYYIKKRPSWKAIATVKKTLNCAVKILLQRDETRMLSKNIKQSVVTTTKIDIHVVLARYMSIKTLLPPQEAAAVADKNYVIKPRQRPICLWDYQLFVTFKDAHKDFFTSAWFQRQVSL